jgi:hypothetical protein
MAGALADAIPFQGGADAGRVTLTVRFGAL